MSLVLQLSAPPQLWLTSGECLVVSQHCGWSPPKHSRTDVLWALQGTYKGLVFICIKIKYTNINRSKCGSNCSLLSGAGQHSLCPCTWQIDLLQNRPEFSRLLTQMGDPKTVMKHGWKGRCSALKLMGLCFMLPLNTHGRCLGKGLLSDICRCHPLGRKERWVCKANVSGEEPEAKGTK